MRYSLKAQGLQRMRHTGVSFSRAERTNQLRDRRRKVRVTLASGAGLLVVVGLAIATFNLTEALPPEGQGGVARSAPLLDEVLAVPPPTPVIQSTPVIQYIEVPGPPVSAPALDPCVEQIIDRSRTLSIRFEPSTALLTQEGLRDAVAFASLVAACPKVQVTVAGHSDKSGSEDDNLRLSWERAENVMSALAVAGFDTEHYDSVGFGSRRATQSHENRDADRRVEFIVTPMLDHLLAPPN